MVEPRDGSIVRDRNGQWWTARGEVWSCRSARVQWRVWPDLVAEFGPLDVHVWRGTVHNDE